MSRTRGLPLLAVLAAGLAAAGGSASEPATTPAPERIAFVGLRGGNVDVYVTDADGTNVRRLTDDPGRDEAPAWSPDGRRIAFVSTRDHADSSLSGYELYVMDADGSNERRLTDDRRGQGRPRWLSGGRIVVTACGEGDLSTCRLEAVDPDTGRSEPLAVPGAQGALFGSAISPDGSLVAYAQPGEGLFWDASAFDIWRDALAGGQARRLTTDPGNDGDPAWSPDGGRIAFVSDRDRNGHCIFHDCVGSAGEIYVMDADGGAQRRLTRNPASDVSPTWAPDGTRIAFARIPDGRSPQYDLFVTNADGGCETRITSGSAWEWQPDWDRSRGGAGPIRCVDLELTAAASRRFVRSGDAVAYRLSLANVGTLPAGDVRVTLRSPRGAVTVAAAMSTGACMLRPFRCVLGELRPGAGVTLGVTLRLRRGGTATPVLSVRSSGADPDRTNDTARFETIVCTQIGGPGPDRLRGTPGRDVLCGLAGSDVLDGRGGADRLYGGDGNDRLVGGSGRDVIAPDPGCDVVRIRDGERDVASADYDRPPGLVYDVGFDRVSIPGNCRVTRTR